MSALPTTKITATDVARLIGEQESTRKTADDARMADDASFTLSAITAARFVRQGDSVSDIVRAIKDGKIKSELSTNSSLAYHILTGEILMLDGGLPDGFAPRGDERRNLAGVQTLVKSLTNGGMTREARKVIKDAESKSAAVDALVELLVIKDQKSAAKAARKITEPVDGDSEIDEPTTAEPAPKVKTAAQLLQAMQAIASGLDNVTATADDATAARDLAALLVKFASVTVVPASTVGIPMQRVGVAA